MTRVRPIWQAGPWRWRPFSFVVAFVALVTMGIVYTRHVQRTSDARWCDLLVPLDTAYQSQRPQTELGRRVAAAIHQLRRDFRCP